MFFLNTTTQSNTTQPEQPGLSRSLSLLDATMLNIGSMLGSGIFIVPGMVALTLMSADLTISVWVFGGIFSLCGALCMAELGAMMPRSGGQYVYLKEAYGPLWGFLYGWASFGVITSAAISAVAVAFATYLSYFFPLSQWGINLVAISSIMLLTGINCLGVKAGALVQNIFTFLKVAAFAVLILLSYFLSDGNTTNSTATFAMPANLIGAFGLALISVLWTYDGWIEITYVGSEVKNPRRNMPLSIILSTMGIIVIYILVNLAYQRVLPMDAIAKSSLVASDVAVALIGTVGATFVTIAVIVATFGSENGFIFTGARIYYAMAKEGLFFKSLAEIHPKYQTPLKSLLVQGVWSSALVLTGSYNQLITYVMVASWLFYSMSAGAVMILRKKNHGAERSYKTWGYPVTPVLFILVSLFLVINAIIEAPRDTAVGALIVALGVPAYWYWKTKAPRALT